MSSAEMCVVQQPKCCRCKENPCARSHRWCLSCHAANMRARRAAGLVNVRRPHRRFAVVRRRPTGRRPTGRLTEYQLLTDEQRRKVNCRSHTNMLIKRGRLVRQPCRVCGNPKADAHHTDYNNPRLVDWLCRLCHVAEHRHQRAGREQKVAA